MTTAALPIPRRRARLGPYAVWQARDFVMNVGIVTLVLFSLFGAITLLTLHTQDQIAAQQHFVLTMAQKLVAFRGDLSAFGMAGPIIAMSGVISVDRTQGYTRFLFAKPLSPRAFYAQSFLIRMMGYLAVGVILAAMYGHYQPIPAMPRIVADYALTFLAVGGLVFFLSSLTRVEGLLVVVWLLLASIVRDNWETVTGPKMWLTYVFPPINHVGELHAWTIGVNALGSMADVAFPTKWVVWNGGYGLAGVVLGLYLLRKLPLTKA